MTMARDLTRWNRSGLSRFDYVNGGAAEWLEALRVHFLQLSAGKNNGSVLPAALPSDSGEFSAMLAGDSALSMDELSALGATWQFLEARETDPKFRGSNRARSFEEGVLARYYNNSPDQAQHISRAFARAVYLLSRSLDAYAQEGFITTVTQPENMRRLLAMTGFRATPPSSAQMPVALILKADSADESFEAGLQIEPRVPGEKAPLTFESLDPVDATPVLNKFDAAGKFEPSVAWSGNRTSETLVRFTTLSAVEGVARRSIGLLLRSNGAPLPLRVVEIDGRQISANRIPAAASPAQSESLLLAPSVSAVPRKTGPGWYPLNRDHGLRIGMAVAPSASATSGYRISAVAGSDVYLTDRDGAPATASISQLFEAVPESVLANASRNAAAVPPVPTLPFLLNTSPADLNALTVSPSAGPLPVSDSIRNSPEKQLFIDNVDVKVLEPGAWLVGELEDGGLAAFLIIASGQADDSTWVELEAADGQDTIHAIRTITAGFNASPVIAREKRSNSPLVQAGGMIRTGLAPDAIAETILGRRRNFLVVPDAPAGGAAYAISGRLQRQGQFLRINIDTGAALQDLRNSALTAGNVSIHGNVVTFGHGKTMPPTPLGSGSGTVEGQSFSFAGGPLATRLSAFDEGGVAPDLTVHVGQREYRRISSLDKLTGEDEAVYDIQVDVDGRNRFIFPRRLPTGTDNVVISRLRIGAGEIGNRVPEYAVTKLSKSKGSIASVVQPLAPQLGRDLQSIETLKKDNGRAIRNVSRAITDEDFAILAERHAGVWQASARSTIDGFGGGRIVVAVTIVPAGGGSIDSLTAPLAASLQAAAIPSVSVQISRFVPVRLTCSLTCVLKSGYTASDDMVSEIKAIVLARYGLQYRTIGDTLFVSGIVSAVEAHQAIDYLDMETDLKPEANGTLPAVKVVRNSDDSLQSVIAGKTESIFIESDDLTVVLTPSTER
ncbi:hypothetical protein [Hoeflea ulvae]|uniref:Baseplate protein J-like domain-containing protein n=1 Tax=Hoeflea ulvae TaxID=2983764 RepID=A0ABT3YL05_9HYPH|nr:hypothetical protein [Hoeflea ulvae]MCY0096589.1 hypothetical protein [Hoeflea ulvae]